MGNEQLMQRLPPQSLETEVAVLGGIIVNNEIIPVAKEMISVDYFYREAHRKIFAAILAIYESEGAVDLTAVCEQLKKDGCLEEVGGAIFISELLNIACLPSLIEHHAVVIKEKAVRRKLIHFSMGLINNAHSETEALGQTLADFQRGADEILRQTDGLKIERLEFDFERLKASLSLRETPYNILNQQINGYFGGELVVVGALTGIGKTSFICDALRYTGIQQGKQVIYFGAATSDIRLPMRMLSAMTMIPFQKLAAGRITHDQAAQLMAAQKQACEAVLFHISSQKIDASKLVASVKRKKAELGDLGLVTIETLQDLVWPGKFSSRKEEVDTIMAALINLAISIDAPVILSGQFKQDKERGSRRPTIDDLKDSGTIAEQATKVFLLHRPAYHVMVSSAQNVPEVGELIIAKGGPPMVLPLEFCGYCYAWRDVGRFEKKRRVKKQK